MRIGIDHLEALYAKTDDPWHFRTSAYEKAKFNRTLSTLPRPHPTAALEVGCGNGELARRLAPRCGAYTGVDAVETALAAARRAVPGGRFLRAFLPCDLPPGDYDLILLSEILYFLDAAALDALARQLDARWPRADLVAVTWLGASGNPLSGEAALALFAAATTRAARNSRLEDRYRIDVFAPLAEAAT